MELAAAAHVQRWLLPSTLPALPGISIATSYHTAKRSGGDYYDVMKLPDGRLGFLIADVSGKGAPAAVLMAIVRTIVHLRQSQWSQPASLLHELNSNLCGLDLINHGAFVTAFYAVLDPYSGDLVYSSAGHHPPRLIRSRQARIFGLDKVGDLPLGMNIDTRYSDTLVLYTDGIVDTCSEKGELFGIERLDQVLRGLLPALSAQESIHAAQHAVEVFSGAATLSDDQTFVAVKMNTSK
jgi:sigma-B regulation protein RsbU (phosphoserine phosphatase)